ncbi:hypothetical protein [Oceaniglobus trochenteri]|uniref:hypothetical protein n=1 Tax=Oceaniglobus trochenteri TaxID=2763260 RepID=UPI001CFFC8CB|nr:hypothetical protein [Oceaniglobus trochenteri]
MPHLRFLHPSIFYLTGLALAGGASGMFYLDTQATAARVLALRQGPPAAVEVERFDSVLHSGPTGEVMIIAQVDAALPLQAILPHGLGQQRVLAYPFLAAGAEETERPQVVGYFYTVAPMTEIEVLDMARLMPTYEKVGDYGPVAAINGELDAIAALDGALSDILRARGREVADSLVGIAAYPEGRAAALSEPKRSLPGYVLALAAMIALIFGGALSRLRPGWEENRRLDHIARRGRRRPGAVPEPVTDKGRKRLAPLAPQPTRPATPRDRLLRDLFGRREKSH